MQLESKAFAVSTDYTENPHKKSVHEKRKGGPNTTEGQSPAKRQKQTSQTRKKGYGKNKDVAQKSIVAEELKSKIGRVDSAREKQQKFSDSGRNKVYTDQCTAFISKLSLKANYEDLHKFFSDIGGVVSIRILHDKFDGKSKGLAYIDFSDDEHLAAVIRKNRQMLLGKKVSIARSDPKRSKKGGNNNSKQNCKSNSL